VNPEPIAVIGAGIVGLTTALLLARRGRRVVVIDRRDDLWAGTSAVGEGKIHLGPVYALGDRATHEVMIRGALAFAPVLEHAVEHRLPWDSMTSEPFDYLVMPTSLVPADDLARRYRDMNDTLERLRTRSRGARYLGEPLDLLIDPVVRRDAATGLDVFRSRERAVDPTRLSRLVRDAALRHPALTTCLRSPVVAVDAAVGRVTVDRPEEGREVLGPFAAVVNCAWEGRSRLGAVNGNAPNPQNIRVKAMVRLRPGTGAARSVTLVQGPFGDVVAHPDFTYASWYPVARVHHEIAVHPSDRVAVAVEEAGCSRSLARAQIEALAGVGLLDGREEILAMGAGVILGDGRHDIDDAGSGLHRRERFGTHVDGRLLTPVNYKLTTGPLAARDACDRTIAVADG
jgi:glycine/D-amino acid oxidase-like deaminating enzyme